MKKKRRIRMSDQWWGSEWGKWARVKATKNPIIVFFSFFSGLGRYKYLK